MNKALIFDLDGTLLNDEHDINHKTIDAIEKAKEHGYKIMIATGRSYQQSLTEIKMIGATDYCVLCNGALIYDVKNNKMIENSQPLTKDVINHFLSMVKKYESGFMIYSLVDNYFYYACKEAKLSLEPFLFNAINLSNLRIDIIERLLLNIPVFSISQFSNLINEQEYIKSFQDYKDMKKKCNMSSAYKGFVDIYGYDVSKWSGFCKVNEWLNLDLENTYYFGDSLNDFEIMSNLKKTVAMGNANKKIKEIAKFTIGDNNSDAIANFIENLINN